MSALKNILCPTDFSKNADHALNFAVDLARKFDSTLHVHHAINIPHTTLAYEIGSEAAAAREIAKENAQKKLDEVAAKVNAQGVDLQVHLTVGAPFLEIIDVAREQHADLIVIGKRGISSVQQMMIGATAEKVVRKSPCDVLSVKHPEHEFVHP